MRIHLHVTRLLIAIATMISTTLTIASDGQLEINQACAVKTGCFSGDTPGFPVTITQPGSYRLTGNLVIPSVDSDGIRISTSDVSIDLGGFTIMGLACVGEQSNCTPSSLGSGAGIASQTLSDTYRGISVKNGSIIGMGREGVLLGDQSEVSSLRLRWNRGSGIAVRAGSTISGNTAYQNGGAGIVAQSGSTISGNTAYKNGASGISGGGGVTVSGNTAYQNGGDGISLGFPGATASNNTVYENGLKGISGGVGVTVSGNTAYQNGGDGIIALGGSAVLGNTVYINTG